ncbi:shikimate 5-dehydrogenase [Fervidicella metallireducens AeB]|uniref:Shikimate dehydrogenase (NADP(+)) n=1 Tax=Fervidicella metallireducens AeB TaxID=1403537 RepID=A0A017RYM8_9CLOT|nr:shikimate 5-dehydrogenase [Fervidicella metallireducens AeB]
MSDVYGLIGKKLLHSFSPKIHSLLLKEMDLEGRYNLYEIEEEKLEESFLNLKNIGVKGLNVTIPYKVKIINYLDKLSDEAVKIGAVNTIQFLNGKALGYNTDYFGFKLTIEKYGVRVKNTRALILGTGGAARVVYHYLVDSGVSEVAFCSRDIKNVKMDSDKKIISYGDIKYENNFDLLINCTPCGMYPDTGVSPIAEEEIEKFSTIIDLIYNPKETLLIKYGKERGLKTINGLYMLVAQAYASQCIWNLREITVNDIIIDNIVAIMTN